MSSKSPVRSADDIDETVLSYAEIKALCAGNPLIAEKMQLDNEVAKLRMLKADHKSRRYRLEDNLIKTYPQRAKAAAERIAGLEKDIAAYAEQKEKSIGAHAAAAEFPGMTIAGVTHTEKESAAKALLDACKEGVAKANPTEKQIGEYMGFKLVASYDTVYKADGAHGVFNLHLRGNLTYKIELGADAFGNIIRINNGFERLPETLEREREKLADTAAQTEAAKAELAKPFPLEAELAEKEARLALLNAELNMDKDTPEDCEVEAESPGEDRDDEWGDDDGNDEPGKQTIRIGGIAANLAVMKSRCENAGRESAAAIGQNRHNSTPVR